MLFLSQKVGKNLIQPFLLIWQTNKQTNIILNSVRQHNYFITQGNYIGYIFRL